MKKYAIDVHWDVAHCFEVVASSQKEAIEKMWNEINMGNLSPHDCGWEATDDVDVLCSGEEGDDGEIEFY